MCTGRTEMTKTSDDRNRPGEEFVAVSWTGQLFVFSRDDGKYEVGITLPSGVVDASRLQVFNGNGPYPPTGFPGTVTVDDLGGWMAQQQKAGFSFTPGHI